MKLSKITISALAAFGLAMTTQTPAATLYVDQHYGPGGNGSSNAPYNTIQAAINDANSTVIIVHPGTYAESLSVGKSLSILGYNGPLTTLVNAAGGSNVVSLAQGLTVTVQGLTLSSGALGVYQPTAGSLYLKNCILCGNRSHGVSIDRTTASACPSVYIYNCVVVNNGGSGVYTGCLYNGSDNVPNLAMYNTFLANNTRYGVEISLTS